jgi:hypothetical protein
MSRELLHGSRSTAPVMTVSLAGVRTGRGLSAVTCSAVLHGDAASVVETYLASKWLRLWKYSAYFRATVPFRHMLHITWDLSFNKESYYGQLVRELPFTLRVMHRHTNVVGAIYCSIILEHGSHYSSFFKMTVSILILYFVSVLNIEKSLLD